MPPGRSGSQGPRGSQPCGVCGPSGGHLSAVSRSLPWCGTHSAHTEKFFIVLRRRRKTSDKEKLPLSKSRDLDLDNGSYCVKFAAPESLFR